MHFTLAAFRALFACFSTLNGCAVRRPLFGRHGTFHTRVVRFVVVPEAEHTICVDCSIEGFETFRCCPCWARTPHCYGFAKGACRRVQREIVTPRSAAAHLGCVPIKIGAGAEESFECAECNVLPHCVPDLVADGKVAIDEKLITAFPANFRVRIPAPVERELPRYGVALAISICCDVDDAKARRVYPGM